MTEELCEKCHYREQSRESCREYLRKHPDGKGGMICDPTPKIECKDHELYGVSPVGNKTICHDFREKEGFMTDQCKNCAIKESYIDELCIHLDKTKVWLNECKIQLTAADEGLLKSNDPKNPWQGIHAECKGWMERAEKAETELAKLQKERILNETK